MYKRILSHAIVAAVYFLLASKAVFAVSFGDFDPRSLGMGGAGVASGNSANAAYYNPALLAMFPTRKEIGKNSQFIVPTLTARISNAVETIDDAQQNNLDQDLINAISTFNQAQNAQNAQSVLQASRDLETKLDDFLDGPVHADVNAAIVLGIGHKYEGGSIMINRRLVADGAVENFENDLQLLDSYVEAMQFIEDGGDPVTAATLYPEVFAANGTLEDNLTSSAVGGALLLTEIAMSMAGNFTIAQQTFAVGITPKVVHVESFDFIADATTDTTTDVRDDYEDWHVNLDLGIARQFDRNWRGGLVIKNIHNLKFQTSLGNTIELKPQVRMGVMHSSHAGVYAMDLDVVKNQPVRRGSESQLLSLGGEWRVLTNTLLRAGAAKNLAGIDAGSKILYTLGVHWGILNGVLDFTYAESSYERAAGLQTGFRF